MRAVVKVESYLASLAEVRGRAMLMPETWRVSLASNDFPGEGIVLISPENYIKVIKGSSQTLTLTVQQSDGTVQDMTGARVYLTVKRQISDRSPLLQKVSTSASQILVDGQNARLGKVSIYFVPSDTSTLETGNYIFDVWAIFPDNRRIVLIPPSIFEVTAGVTWLG